MALLIGCAIVYAFLQIQSAIITLHSLQLVQAGYGWAYLCSIRLWVFGRLGVSVLIVLIAAEVFRLRVPRKRFAIVLVTLAVVSLSANVVMVIAFFKRPWPTTLIQEIAELVTTLGAYFTLNLILVSLAMRIRGRENSLLFACWGVVIIAGIIGWHHDPLYALTTIAYWIGGGGVPNAPAATNVLGSPIDLRELYFTVGSWWSWWDKNICPLVWAALALAVFGFSRSLHGGIRGAVQPDDEPHSAKNSSLS